MTLEQEIRSHASHLRDIWGDNLEQVWLHLDQEFENEPGSFGLVEDVMHEFEDELILAELDKITPAQPRESV
jgi:hypothetical protein